MPCTDGTYSFRIQEMHLCVKVQGHGANIRLARFKNKYFNWQIRLIALHNIKEAFILQELFEKVIVKCLRVHNNWFL